MSLLDATAFDALLEIVEEATELAKQAVEEAESAASFAHERSERAAPQVLLTKVASNGTYDRVAGVLAATGFCKAGKSAALKLLKDNGETGILECVEKLASTAIFPIDFATESLGELVEKKAGINHHRNSDGSVNMTALWRNSIDEAREEIR